MGRRRTRAMKPPKKRDAVDVVFNCPWCSGAKTVEVKMKRQEKYAHLKCRRCMIDHKMPISYLHEPIDVYSDWVDKCDAANQNVAASPQRRKRERRDPSTGAEPARKRAAVGESRRPVATTNREAREAPQRAEPVDDANKLSDALFAEGSDAFDSDPETKEDTNVGTKAAELEVLDKLASEATSGIFRDR